MTEYGEFDRIVADETDPVRIEALKAVWNIWDRNKVPWMAPQRGRCTHCGMPGRVITHLSDLSSECSSCYFERRVRELREEERKQEFTRKPKFDLEDFTRI